MLELYNYYRSSASFRVRIALNLKNIDYKEIPIHLINNGGEQHAATFKQINTQKLVPVLKNGEHTISQSLAIIEYLEELHPSPPLLPKDPYQKAIVRSFALAIAAEIHPLNNLRVLQYLTNDLKISEEQKTTWIQHWITLGLTALEERLAQQNHHSDYCFGDTPGLADIFLIPQLFNAKRFSCNLASFPIINKIDAHCQKNPAFTKATPHE